MTGFTFTLFEGENAKKVDKAFGVENALYEYNPGKCLLPPVHSLFAQRILDADVRKEDVWLISFPRTGSTWCQEMVWLIGNNYDYEKTQTIPQQTRAPLLELSSLLFQHKEAIDSLYLLKDSVDFVANMSSPRYIKSHLPMGLLPTKLNEVKPKIICTLRNPKDMVISFYHYCRLLHNLDLPFEEFCELFMKNALPFGSVWDHYLGFWNKRHDSNMLVLKYEDMKKDMPKTLRQIAEHLEKDITDKDIEDMTEFLSFNKMRDNKGVNLSHFMDHWKGPDYYKKSGEHFIRKGIVGDWKNVMSPELASRFDKWIEENTAGTGLSFE